MEQLRPHCLHFPGGGEGFSVPVPGAGRQAAGDGEHRFPPGGAGTGRAGRRFRRDGRLPVPVHGGKVLPCQGHGPRRQDSRPPGGDGDEMISILLS